jgi:hypothetical protein
MPTGNTTLLGLALPVEGELDGTWGTTVNNSITSLVDSAVAGTTTLSVDADVTLTTTALAANEARQAILRWTASNGATTRNITAPAQSKPYIVINAGTGSIVLRGAGPTTGVTITAGERCLVAWNGSDFVKITADQVYPGAGMAVSTGTAWGTSKTTPTGDVVGTSDTQTLTNKTLTTPVVTENVQVVGINTTASVSRIYVMTASITLTLPASPGAGDWVGVSNRSGTITPDIARNGENIMGLAEDLILDSLNAGFTLSYADATRGWVIL